MSAQLHIPAVVIGGGPAGLMAAEQLALAGIKVAVFEQKPTVGRKFLRAGIGGLNITHSEAFETFQHRYGTRSTELKPWLDTFGPDDVIAWCEKLGINTFLGSSGRVFPEQMKAAPLLRRWLERLRKHNVDILTRHRWQGWDKNALVFEHQGQTLTVHSDITVLALGGASWPKLGSDGQWHNTLIEQGLECAPFRPSNCGFNYDWPKHLPEKTFGAPLKHIGLHMGDSWNKTGDALISHYGIEGSLIYAASPQIRDQIEYTGSCTVHWDLLPDQSVEHLAATLTQRKRGESAVNTLRKLGVRDGKLSLLKALTRKSQMQTLSASLLKALPQTFTSYRPLEEAISVAGGVRFSEIDDHLMCRTHPGLFLAGEMLDWEAQTGGYLLTACFASGYVAGQGALAYLKQYCPAPAH